MQKLILLFAFFNVFTQPMEETEQASRQFIPSIIKLSNRTENSVFILGEHKLRPKTAAEISVNKTDKDNGKLWFTVNGEGYTLCYPHGKSASGPYTAKIDIQTACYLLAAKEIPPSTASCTAVQFVNNTDKMLFVTHPNKSENTINCDEVIYKGAKSEPVETTFALQEKAEENTITIPVNIEGIKHSVICLRRTKKESINSETNNNAVLLLYVQTIALLANGYELRKGLPKKEQSKSWLSCVMQ